MTSAPASYEGKAKSLHREGSGELVQVFKDQLTAFDGEKVSPCPGKGKLNAQMSAWLFEYLETQGVRTHFLEDLGEGRIRTQELEMLPVEVVIRNRMAGSLIKRLGGDEGFSLKPPVVEWYLKDDARHDPQISEDLLVSFFGWKSSLVEEIRKQALEVNEALLHLFARAGLELVDFKLEFGLDSQKKLILGDEISPDSCRVWRSDTGEKLDKDRFRFDLGEPLEGYREIHRRLKETLNK